MFSDVLAERIAAVRVRFAAKLEGRLNEIAVPLRSGQEPADFAALVVAHREAHNLCGVGPTLGFHDTGKAARSVEQLLLAAVKAKRMLREDEIPVLQERIAALRSTASAELQSAHA